MISVIFYFYSKNKKTKDTQLKDKKNNINYNLLDLFDNSSKTQKKITETKKDESLAIRNELEKKDMELQNELIPILENPKSPSLSSVASDKPKDCNPATYHGLHEWHKYMFEKLGWMFLTINKGNQNPEKITSYKN